MLIPVKIVKFRYWLSALNFEVRPSTTDLKKPANLKIANASTTTLKEVCHSQQQLHHC